MFQPRIKPLDEREKPRPGRPESVIPPRELKRTKDGLRPRVPAFELIAKIPMYWDGLCVDAGHNYVDVARFEALPPKTRQAVKTQILEGAFMLRGYREAKESLPKGEPKPKPRPVAAQPDPQRRAEADEIEIEEADVVEDEPPADDADVLG